MNNICIFLLLKKQIFKTIFFVTFVLYIWSTYLLLLVIQMLQKAFIKS